MYFFDNKALECLNSIKFENDIEERVDKCKQDAEKIVSGSIDDEADFFSKMRYIVSRHYNIPYFSEIFDRLTLEQIVFEVCLLSTKPKTSIESASELIKSDIEEAASIFDDMEAEEDAKAAELSEEEKKSIEKDMLTFKKGGFAAVMEKGDSDERC